MPRLVGIQTPSIINGFKEDLLNQKWFYIDMFQMFGPSKPWINSLNHLGFQVQVPGVPQPRGAWAKKGLEGVWHGAVERCGGAFFRLFFLMGFTSNDCDLSNEKDDWILIQVVIEWWETMYRWIHRHWIWIWMEIYWEYLGRS